MSFEYHIGQDGSVSPASAALVGAWDFLKIQLSPFSRVITIREDIFNSFDETTRNFISNRMMQETGDEARYVRDISGGRVFLGSIANLATPSTIILDMPNYDLPVLLPSTSILGGGVSAPSTVPAPSQEFQNNFQPAYYGATTQPMPAMLAQPEITMLPAQHDFTMSSQSAQPTAGTTYEDETPTKSQRGGSAKKRKTAVPKTPKPHPFNNGNGPSGGYSGGDMSVNLDSIVDDKSTGVVDDFEIKHDSKYRKPVGGYRSNGPRPQNAFILYRSHMHKSVAAQHPGVRNNVLSKMIGEMWRALPEDEKQIWKLRQVRAKREHKKIWPEYKYDPVQPWEKEKHTPQHDQQKCAEGKAQGVPALSGMHTQLALPTAPNPVPAAAEPRVFLETEEGLNLLSEFTYADQLAATTLTTNPNTDNTADNPPENASTPNEQELGDLVGAELEKEMNNMNGVTDAAPAVNAPAASDDAPVPSFDTSIPPVDMNAPTAGMSDLGMDNQGDFDLNFEDYTMGGGFDRDLLYDADNSADQ